MFGVDNGGGGGRSNASNGSRSDGGDGGGAGEAAGVDGAPTTIMHAAYVGALELVKSMVEVRNPCCCFCCFCCFVSCCCCLPTVILKTSAVHVLS